MSRYSLQQFVQQTAQQELNQGTFELESDRMLEVNLNGMVWMKMGAMVAYRGQVKFTREGLLEQGLGSLLKKAVSGEGARLTKGEGQGKMYLADHARLTPDKPALISADTGRVVTFAQLDEQAVKALFAKKA